MSPARFFGLALALAALLRAPAQSLLPAGPWGTIAVYEIDLQPPDEAIRHHSLPIAREWAVLAADDTAVDGFFARAGLEPGLRHTLLAHGHRDPADPSFWVVEPPDATRRDLDAATRAQLYHALAQYWRNGVHVLPLPVPTSAAAWALANLNPTLRAAISQLSFERRGQSVLVDADLLIPLVRDDAELLRLKRFFSTTHALQLELQRSSLAHRDSLIRYWSLPGLRSPADVIAWLDQSPELPAVDLWNLLPSNARRLYNAFMPPQSGGRLYNCFWASLNFAAYPPDNQLLVTEDLDHDCAAYAFERLQREYEIVSPPFQFGDQMALINRAGEEATLEHVMTYIAADIVLTKNGYSPTRPLVFMRVKDVLAAYPTPVPLQLTVFRRRAAP